MKCLLTILVLLATCYSTQLLAVDNAQINNFDVEAATMAYLNQLNPEEQLASDAYFEGSNWLNLWDLLYGLLIAWVLLHFRISTKMRDIGNKFTRSPYLNSVAYIVQYTLLVFVVAIPLTIYVGFIREHDYGLSNMTFASWFGEQLIGLGLSLSIGSLGIALIYLVIRKASNSWHIWGSVLGVLMLVLMMMVAPVFISPLFNDYTPLEDGPVKQKILSLARANGVPAEEVYQFDASKQSKRISANVSGLFGTTRISLNDNLLNRTSPEAIEAVMAHEIGHYVLNHGTKMILSLGLLLVVGFGFVRWSFDRVNNPAWGIKGVADIAGLPLFFALFSIYFFIMTPVFNTIIRTSEVEADIFALNASRQPDGLSEAFLGLAEYRKMNPGYWEEIIFFDHPSGYNRIHMAMQWKKENLQ